MKGFHRPEPESGPLAGPDDDVDRELRAHLDARIEALTDEGRSPDEARAQALREFGDLEDARRDMRRSGARAARAYRRRNHMSDFLHDVTYAFRRLRSAPAFTLTSLLTLALGIGATTAIFSLVYGVVFRPLPYPSPDHLYAVYSANESAGQLRGGVSAVDIDDWRARRRDLQDVGAVWFSSGSSGVDLTGRGEPRRVPAAFVTPGFFEALGVTAAVGRLPREEELTRAGNDDIVLLSHRFWQREFAGDSSVVGSSLTVGGRAVTVLGVLPASLQYPSDEPELFLAFSSIPDSSIPRLRVVRVLTAIARARPGVSQAAVDAELDAITGQLAQQYPENRNWNTATVVPLAEVIAGPVENGLLVLLAAVGLVLLMVAVNVAALQVTRAAGRGRELAVRVALGARRGRLVRQLITESLVLTSLGCVAGVAVAVLALRGLVALAAGQLPRLAEVSIDVVALGCAVGVSVVVGLVCGLAPALRAARTDPQQALGANARGTVGADSQHLRSGLVVAEMAVAVVLVIGAVLMSRSFMALLDTDPGFAPEGLVAVQFTIDGDRHATPPDPAVPGLRGYMAYYRQVIDRVRTLPGVISAAAVKDAPFRGNGERNGFTIVGHPVPAGEDSPTATVIHVSDGYFATIGARMAEGREYTPQDRAGGPVVLVVNEAFGRRFFPGESVVGRQLLFGGQVTAEIVGVVRDIRQVSMREPAVPTIYMNNMINGRVQTTVVVRAAGDPMALVPDIRRAIHALDPQQPITRVFTFEESRGLALAQPRLLVVLLGGFGVLGLTLGLIGIYGVLSALVSQRRQEIGVRMMLGASPADVQGMVLRRGLWLTVTGITIGLIVVWLVSGYLDTVLYQVQTRDPWTLLGVIFLLGGTALVAGWLPARRATRIDPATAMRID